MASPLILGNDPRAMSKATLQILLAGEVVAVNQDPMGRQGKQVGGEGSAGVGRRGPPYNRT